MSILALDLANRMGFALRDSNQRLQLGTVTFGNTLTRSPGGRWKEFYLWLDGILTRYGVSGVAYEAVVNSSRVPGRQRTGQVYGGWLAILELWAFENSIELVPYGVTKIKAFATGVSGADKTRMIEAAQRALIAEQRAGRMGGIAGFDDNAADAYWILRLHEHLRKQM